MNGLSSERPSQQETKITEIASREFPIPFTYEGGNFQVQSYPFSSESDWIMLSITRSKGQRLRKKSWDEVGYLVAKPGIDKNTERPLLHIMGNYNVSGRHGKEDPVHGIVGHAIQEIVQETGIGMKVSGLTSQGEELYKRLLKSHRDTVVVEKRGHEYYILPTG